MYRRNLTAEYCRQYREIEAPATEALLKAARIEPTSAARAGAFAMALQLSAYWLLELNPYEGIRSETPGYWVLRVWLVPKELMVLIVYRVNEDRKEVDLLRISASKPMIG